MAIQHDDPVPPGAGQDVDDEGGGQPVPARREDEEEGAPRRTDDDGAGQPRLSRRVPWWIWLVLAVLVAGGVYAISRGCDGGPMPPPVKPPAPTAPAPPTAPGTPPAFEEIVLEVDPIEYTRSCLAAGGTGAGCQATLGDMTVK